MEKLTQRSLVYDEGTSDKFWSIRVDGLTHTVHYGRVGTAGQVKAKAFDTGDAAVAAAEKLINDKLRKGYRDAGQPGEMPDPVPAEATLAPVAVEVVDEPAPALVAPVAIADDVRPALDLLPHEWSLATWRPLHEAPAAEPRPFDPKLLREAVRTVNAEQARWGWWNWPSSPVSFPMTREEAAYWLRLGQRFSWRMTPLKRHAAVLEQGPDISADEAIELARECQLPEGEVMAPLLTLLGTERMLELLLTPRRKPSNEGACARSVLGCPGLSHAAPQR
jgi:predicted DNA-binding WGR domain protein